MPERELRHASRHRKDVDDFHRQRRSNACVPFGEQKFLRGLRKELEDSTNSFNSATILIADRRGREEIVRALNGLPSTLRTRLATSLTSKQPAASPQSHDETNPPWAKFLRRNWVEILLPGAVGLIVWLAFNFR